MTRAFETCEEIGHPPDQVWRTLTDWERAAAWMPGVATSRADGPTETGMTLTFTSRGKERTSRVAAFEAGRSLVLRSVQGGVTADYAYRLTPNGAGTLVELTADVTTSGAWRLLGPLIRGAIRRADADQLVGLARAVDAGTSSS